MRNQALGRGQGHIHRVGVTTEIITRFEHRDVGLPLERVCHSQARDARADNGQLHAGRIHGAVFNDFSIAETSVLLSGPVMLP